MGERTRCGDRARCCEYVERDGNVAANPVRSVLTDVTAVGSVLVSRQHECEMARKGMFLRSSRPSTSVSAVEMLVANSESHIELHTANCSVSRSKTATSRRDLRVCDSA